MAFKSRKRQESVGNEQVTINAPSTEMKKRTLKTILRALIFIVLAIGVVAGGYYIFKNVVSRNRVAEDPCNSKILKEAVPYIDPADPKLAKLKPIVKQIESNEEYMQNVNCVYIALRFYIGINDKEKTKQAYEQLVKTYDAKVGYDPIINSMAIAPINLKTTVDFVQNMKNGYSQHGPDKDGNFE